MSDKSIIILGIESSCDETSAAVLADGKILANIIASQKVHETYGGVVPELASRAHQQNIVPVVDQAIKASKIDKRNISAISYTRGPGLMGSLLVGASFAKAMALALNIPLIEVNHLQAHIHAHFIIEKDGFSNQPGFPFLCLTVSGGHTQIVRVNNFFEMKLLGETIDDAAGEAFDKIAKILGFAYPGGPLIDEYAKTGDAQKFNFTHPNVPGYDFSFSGLKTAFMYFIRDNIKRDSEFIVKNKADICASIQKTIVDILMQNLKQAAIDHNITEIALAGGVSANSLLRKTLKNIGEERNWKVYIPKFEYCTDNAAMIAETGFLKFKHNEFSSQELAPVARLKFI
ncbi:MAG: tRNA (adenosine(37)-N6)-threonylcarbamoyltransferase complex transferase subunit TsaD [Bacteroidetes bacterium]|nr:tRNA (adenosine(37)-N6)-threonylcarbamoyltransferase complex transferase subunit TsaD [Bacteroidota bacterium]HET6245119.1 tRNA (adenosine(37)-N6)-threonylcarbamoyltransferase complex transferase subunit TsaD [Bacteroidia bacterium]